MADPIAVSVLIPVHNAAGFLMDALHSVQKQTLANFECIMIDDASVDDSATLAERFVAADDRFRLIRREKNAGAAAARNDGLAKANGEWITLLDADDLYVSTRLERLTRLGQEEKADIVVDDQVVTEFPATTSPRRAFGFQSPSFAFNQEDFFEGSRLFRRALSAGYMQPLMRRDFLKQTGTTYDTTALSGEDFLFYAHLFATRPRCTATSYAGYIYRRRRGSLSRSDEHLHFHAQLGERVLSELGSQLSSKSRVALAARNRDFDDLARAMPAISALRQRKWLGLPYLLISQPKVARTCIRLLKAHAIRAWCGIKTWSPRVPASDATS